MAYISMKKLIEHANKTLESGAMTAEEYNNFKASSMNKLDVFLTCSRITSGQYEELEGLLKIA